MYKISTKILCGSYPCINKILLVMKITTILLIAGIMQLNAAALAQKISYKQNNVSLKQLFKVIKKQTGYNVLWYDNELDGRKTIDVNFFNTPLEEALNISLKDAALDYIIEEKTIILRKEKKSSVIDMVVDYFKFIDVKGKITDESGQPLPGVRINVKGTKISTSTNSKGEYTIKAGINDVLLFSSLGYKLEEVTVENGSVNITLKADIKALDQVVVIGYGTARKKDLTGAISQVDARRLENESPGNVQEILRANVPGLIVGPNSSAKGGGSLLVRGVKSLSASGTPLLVLDGIIYTGDISDINPYDIKTIDVLKDASSAAVYGSRSANGVIIITTKTGNADKPLINFNSNFGIVGMSVNQPINSAEQYVSWREDVMKSTNAVVQPYQFSDPRNLPSNITTEQWLAYDNSAGDPVEVWLRRLNFQQVEINNYKAGKSVDWYDKVFQNGIQQDYNLSLSQKKEDVSYYFSLGYQDNEGIISGDKFSTFRSRLNLDGKITSFLRVGANTQFSVRDESQVPVSVAQMVNVSPWGSEFNDDGTLRLSPQDLPAVARNPFIDASYTNRLQGYKTLISSLFANVTLPFNITYQLNFTPKFSWHNYYNGQSAKHPEWALRGGMATRADDREYSWQVDNLIKWNKTFNEIHKFEVTLLANAEKSQTWADTIKNEGFKPSDILSYHNIGAGTNPVVSSNDGYRTGDALMARLFYSLKDRYLLTLSVRRDGSSAFGQSNPRTTFPSAAIGWVFSEEDFFKSKWFNYGKLRFSYGVNGNSAIGQYAALSQLSSGDYQHATAEGIVKPITMLQISQMGNPNLKWEKTTSINAGLDFSILNNVLDGSIDAYSMSSNDLLVQRSLPRLVGFNFVLANLGEVQNKGIELNLNSKNMNKENFSWRTSFNFSLNRNKIAHLYGDMQDILDNNGNVTGQRERDDITNKWFIGHDINEIWDFKVLGVYQLNEQDEGAKYGVKPGDFKLEDVNNDGKFTDADKQFLGYTTPRFRWTLRNEFTLFKNIDFSFMLYSQWGQKGTFDEAKNSALSRFLDRQSSYVFPYWTPENPINDFAKLSSSDGSAVYSVYRNKSFIRLDNVAIAYTIPKSILNKVKVQNMKVFFNTRNVGFYSPGEFLWDPENAAPTTRTFTFGLNLTL
jgi:TonB-linked SusC/RagA family outer membrane protein